MKMFCISDSIEAAIILKTAGVESVVLTEKKEIEEKLKEVLENEEIAILAVTDHIYSLLQNTFDDMRKNRKYPLIVRIPDNNP